MFKLRVLEKVMQAVTVVSKFVHNVKDKIKEIGAKAGCSCREGQEDQVDQVEQVEGIETKLAKHTEETTGKEVLDNKVAQKQKEVFSYSKYGLMKKGNIIYLPSVLKKQGLTLKGHEDVYIDLVGKRARAPTLKRV